MTHAATVTVTCPPATGGTYTSINEALNAIGPIGPSTIIATGTCNENVSLNGAVSITIVAGAAGATIAGPLDGDTFDISGSQNIVFRNLEITNTFSTTGLGGGDGVLIAEDSDVQIFSCNIHDNQAGGVGVNRNSTVFIRGTTMTRCSSEGAVPQPGPAPHPS